MIDQQNTTTIEQQYTNWTDGIEGPPSSISPQDFFFAEKPVVVQKRATKAKQASGASMLLDYIQDQTIAFEELPVEIAIVGSVLKDHFLQHVGSTDIDAMRQNQVSARQARYAEAIELLNDWLKDDSGYDEATWAGLKEGIEDSRTSTRKRFGD